MRSVILDSDARPIEDVVCGPGGMEQARDRGVVVVNFSIRGASKALAQLAAVGQKVGQDFARSMRQIALMGAVSKEQLEVLEAVILEREQLGKSKPQQAWLRLRWELRRLDAELQTAMVSLGEQVLRARDRVGHTMRRWWAVLCR